MPPLIASFVILAFQYYRIDPDRRVFNLRFGLMVGAIVLMLAAVFMQDWDISLIFFVLALFWLGLSLYLLRYLPPPRH
ncbi:MAG TPA: hypothetical protein VHT74_22660 [Acetobacteraceae bacterium]|nr:hypothetical protein [Acetobacteraceae bacterium]